VKLLLDSHALIWWLSGDHRLSRPARAALERDENDVHVSAATAWEICTKHRIGKLPHSAALAASFEAIVRERGFLLLDMNVRHAAHAASVLGDHKDPFDRMLIAQALLEELTLVSNEARFDAFGVHRLW
jgi:PIN domain nuclease of toxin-antitoxin system